LKKIILLISISITYLYSHCQIPCGIFDDVRNIIEIDEKIITIEKAINNINQLSGKKKLTSHDHNQLTRWINLKDEHVNSIQNTMGSYFLAQRIKPKDEKDNGYNKYVNLTTTCQKIIFVSMKTKQNIDLSFTAELKQLVENFSNLYFDEHGLNHLNQYKNK
tara:strand:- start:99 stop:584 length:486 start_codon:yes stop_codon:yes gene_type:complete